MVKDRAISGLICEFNPLHNGHRHIIDEIRSKTDGFLVCVMSGNFVQRGECAIIDKWSRTRMAIENGADLVIELPLPFAISGAEKFAKSGIKILDALGTADNVFFGSEYGETDKLYEISKFLLGDEFSFKIKDSANGAISFASAREGIIRTSLGDEYGEIISQSNNILGIEYIKALLATGSKIKARTIKRIGADHDGSSDGYITSASDIRSKIYKKSEIKEFMPSESYKILEKGIKSGYFPASTDNVTRAILFHLRTTTAEKLKSVPDVREGIENKIISAALECDSLETLYNMVKSKRYSHARIRRIILSSFLGIAKADTEEIPYIRILGMNKNGEEIIRNSTPSIPVVFSYSDIKKLEKTAQNMFDLESTADDVFGLITEKIMDGKTNFTTRFIKY